MKKLFLTFFNLKNQVYVINVNRRKIKKKREKAKLSNKSRQYFKRE